MLIDDIPAFKRMQYEWNARTQITMWFDNTNTKASLLRDYGKTHRTTPFCPLLRVPPCSFLTSSGAANKYWSGLLRDYYGPRAAIYFKHLISSLKKNEPFALEEWRREWISLTNNWQSDRKVFATTATGDALNISRALYIKYLRNADSLGLDGMDSFGKPASL